MLVHSSRANVPMKLNSPDDLLSKMTREFSPSLDNGLIKRFFKIFVAAVFFG